MRKWRGLLHIGVFAALLGCTACSLEPAGPMQHDTARIPLDNAKSAHITLDIGGGDLKVSNGAEMLLSANFDYNVPEWKPTVDSNGLGDVTIRQGSNGGHIGRHQQNQWSIQLNGDVPMEVRTKMGGGDATLALGKLNLRHVEMDLGAGDLTIDLRGSPKTSYDVRVRGGAGDATVYLPAGVGIDATATGGIGDVEAPGLHQDGHRYYNDGLGKSDVTVRLDIEGGVGSIRLIAGN